MVLKNEKGAENMQGATINIHSFFEPCTKDNLEEQKELIASIIADIIQTQQAQDTPAERPE